MGFNERGIIMKIQDCHFTQDNIAIGINNGIVFLLNKDTNETYRVSVVKLLRTAAYPKIIRKVKIKMGE